MADARRRSLRSTLLLALLLVLGVTGSGTAVALWAAGGVQHDVVRLYEELREIGVAGAIADELRGAGHWLDGLPPAAPAVPDLAREDVLRHFTAARAAMQQFHRIEDPSQRDHDLDEVRILANVAAALRRCEVELESGASPAMLRVAMQQAIAAAESVGQAVTSESRRLGQRLTARGDTLRNLLLAVCLASIAVVAGSTWVLHRRVLRPVRALQTGVARLARGERTEVATGMVDDEFGELGASFDAMAAEIGEHQRELERRVEQRSREVLRSARLAELGTLAAGIAHEINNPLASIVACCEGLLRECGEGGPELLAQREYLQIVLKEALRTRDITARLLRLAQRSDAGHGPVPLDELVREVATLFTHQLADAGLTLDLQLPADPDGAGGAVVTGDAGEWRQVLLNLLRNAIDASARGGRITIVVRRDRDAVELVVADRGVGIPAELHERIFEPFFTSKGPDRGTGLGLGIVHRIVQSSGGTIRVESSVGSGARFVIRAPAAGAGGAGGAATRR